MSRVNPHFKVHTSIANHRKMIDVYEDNDLLAFWTRLGIASIERFAARTGDAFLVTDRELMGLAGKKQIRSSEKLLLKLTQCSPIVASKLGKHWNVSFPNLQRKQGFDRNNGDDSFDPHTHAHAHAHKEINISVEQAWLTAQEAAARYGVKWGKLTPIRKRMMVQRLSEHREVGVNAIAQAIHGYVALRKSDTFDWKSYLKPKTLLRPTNFAEYLDAYRKPQAPIETTEPTDSFKANFAKGRKRSG